jgi:lysine-N-methylase
MKLHTLPIIEHWDCHGCSACCRETTIRLSADDLAKLESQRWDEHPEFRGQRITRRLAFLGGAKVLAHKADGSCVFLTGEGRCRIHAEFGPEAKPLACQQFPLQVVATDRDLSVTVLRSCPTAAAGQGKPLSEHLPFLKRLLGDAPRPAGPAAARPVVRGGARSWDDFHRVAGAFERLIADQRIPLVRRVVHAAQLCTLLSESKWNRIDAKAKGELIQLLVESATNDVGQLFSDRKPPTPRVAKLFRRLGAHFVRCYPGGPPIRSLSSHWRAFRASGKLARATTTVPAVHPQFPAVALAQLERPLGPLAVEVLAPLSAFFESHAISKRYALSRSNRPLVESVRRLAFAYPMALWMLRWLAHDRAPTADDIAQIVVALERGLDLPALSPAVNFMADDAQLERLIAWYGR